MMTNDFFKADSFRFKPEFLEPHRHRPLRAPAQPGRLRRHRGPQGAEARCSTSSWPTTWPRASSIRRRRSADPAQGHAPVGGLRHAAGRDLGGAEDRAGDHRCMRRNLQREHLRRVAGALVQARRPRRRPTRARCSARTRARCSSRSAPRSRSPGMSKESRAHLAESLNTLDRGAQGAAAARRRLAPPAATIGLPVVPAGLFSFPPREEPDPGSRIQAGRQRRGSRCCAARSTRTCARSRRRSTSTIARRAERFSISGDPAQVALAARALRKFYDLAAHELSLEDIQLGLVEVSRTPGGSRRGVAGAAAARGRPSSPRARRARPSTCKQMQTHDITFGVGPAGTGQDLPRRGRRRRRVRARRGEAHRAHAPGGGGRREAGLPARRPRAEGGPVPAPALRRALRPHGLRQGEPPLRARRDRGGAARVHARAHAQPLLHHPRRGAEHDARSR